MGDQYGRNVGVCIKRFFELTRICRLSPFDLKPFDICAVDLRDAPEPLTERSDGNCQDTFAGRKHVDDCCFKTTRTG